MHVHVPVVLGWGVCIDSEAAIYFLCLIHVYPYPNGKKNIIIIPKITKKPYPINIAKKLDVPYTCMVPVVHSERA